VALQTSGKELHKSHISLQYDQNLELTSKIENILISFSQLNFKYVIAVAEN